MIETNRRRQMANFCTCDASAVASNGFKMVSGKVICKGCGLPELSSAPQKAPSSNLDSNQGGQGTFLRDLFDMKLDNYISVKFSRFIFAFSVVIYALISIALFLISVSYSPILGGWTILAILGSVAIFFVLTILARLSTELVVVIFQIARDIRTLAGRNQS